jgi:hypothetical protein
MSFPRHSSWVPGSLLLSLCLAGTVLAAKPGAPVNAAPAGAVDFAREIQPLLKARCFACHGGGQSQGGLRLDAREGALRGGDTGAAIKPGHAAESLLLQRVSGVDPKRVMPPSGPRLTAAEIQRLRGWIDAGAPWAGGQAAGARSQGGHWSFRPVNVPPLPAVKDR